MARLEDFHEFGNMTVQEYADRQASIQNEATRAVMTARCMSALTNIQQLTFLRFTCNPDLPLESRRAILIAENALKIAVDALVKPPDFIRRV